MIKFCYKDVELSTKYGKQYGIFHIFPFYHLFVMFMNLIGIVIESLSYNWSISTYRNSNTNAVGVFHCIKLINENGNGIFHNCANTLIQDHLSIVDLMRHVLIMNYEHIHMYASYQE